MFGIGISADFGTDVLRLLYRTYRGVFGCSTELTELSLVVVPNLPKCPVPVVPAVYIPIHRYGRELSIAQKRNRPDQLEKLEDTRQIYFRGDAPL